MPRRALAWRVAWLHRPMVRTCPETARPPVAARLLLIAWSSLLGLGLSAFDFIAVTMIDGGLPARLHPGEMPAYSVGYRSFFGYTGLGLHGRRHGHCSRSRLRPSSWRGGQCITNAAHYKRSR